LSSTFYKTGYFLQRVKNQKSLEISGTWRLAQFLNFGRRIGAAIETASR
jgi:hypothetical protein